MEYVEFTTGFYMIIGKIDYLGKVPGIKLQINSDFHSEKYIISPELLNILEGNITGITDILLAPEAPIFFILLRTNMRSDNLAIPHLRIDDFFDNFEILKRTKKNKEFSKKKDETAMTIFKQLNFEHYFFRSMIDVSIPCIRRSDREVLSQIARNYLSSIKDDPIYP